MTASTAPGVPGPEGEAAHHLARSPAVEHAPEDAASAMCFLASDSASFLTGVVLAADDGRST